MFTEERYQYILEQLSQHGKVLVKDLSQVLSLSESMIRKDLQTLEKKGLLQRTYGGAIPIQRGLSVTESFTKRNEKEHEQKELMAQKAVQEIREDETIFLDASTTSYSIAKLLISQNIRITVITNMYAISSLIPEGCNVTFLFVGGEYNAIVGGCIGSFTNDQIKRYRCNRAFIGCVGVDLSDFTVNTALLDDATLKQTILSVSNRCYLLVNNRKFNAQSSFVYANLSEFDCIITEETPSREIVEQINSAQVNLL